MANAGKKLLFVKVTACYFVIYDCILFCELRKRSEAE